MKSLVERPTLQLQLLQKMSASVVTDSRGWCRTEPPVAPVFRVSPVVAAGAPLLGITEDDGVPAAAGPPHYSPCCPGWAGVTGPGGTGSSAALVFRSCRATSSTPGGGTPGSPSTTPGAPWPPQAQWWSKIIVWVWSHRDKEKYESCPAWAHLPPAFRLTARAYTGESP